jgi:hypothetical protein
VWEMVETSTGQWPVHWRALLLHVLEISKEQNRWVDISRHLEKEIENGEKRERKRRNKTNETS